ncbi:hypothetical protein [Agreia sp.]|uniref:hypothetical protein n=1 Tax=Agreia sp. TaxID=1872416 RepID=UPI0035BBD11D
MVGVRIVFPYVRHAREWSTDDFGVWLSSPTEGDRQIDGNAAAWMSAKNLTEIPVLKSEIIQMVGVAELIELLADLHWQLTSGVSILQPTNPDILRIHYVNVLNFLAVVVPAGLHGPYTQSTKDLAFANLQGIHRDFIRDRQKAEPGRWGQPVA